MAVSTARTRTSATDTADPPLGGLSAASFLRRYWQKDALLVRSAIAGFTGPLDARQLFTLARRDDIESRLIVRDGARWSLVHGPLRASDFAALPARNWTLLVQGVNLLSAAGDALLRRFAFVPYARLDDLMVSYAAPGGGVGAHVDSYDVFLLQGFGRRRWHYGRQDDHAMKPRLPLKILRRFQPTHSEILSPGDMLYLPPSYAHDGVAFDACTTYSIGFRAPGAAELAAAFLDFLRDELDLPGRYADPGLRPTRSPAQIDGAMRRRCERLLARISWNRATIGRFLGEFLSEPKAHVFFDKPRAPLRHAAFAARAARHGVHLDLGTQLLYDSDRIFINGTAMRWPGSDTSALKRLANARALTPRTLAHIDSNAAAILYGWYRDGYLHTGTH